MAANDAIAGVSQIMRQTRSRDRRLVIGPQAITDLDETAVATQTFINGGAPANAGRTIMSAPEVFGPGERVVIQVKSNATKTLDTTGSTSGLFVIQVLCKDINTGARYQKTLVEGDRNTAELADDPILTASVFGDAYHFVVPDGEAWQLFGKWQFDARTTA